MPQKGALFLFFFSRLTNNHFFFYFANINNLGHVSAQPAQGFKIYYPGIDIWYNAEMVSWRLYKVMGYIQ